MRSRRYLVKKFLQALLTLVFVLSFNFFLFRIMPSDPARFLARSGRLSAQQAARLEHELGLDKALPQQFVIYVKDTLSGNLGLSFIDGAPVTEVLAKNLKRTLLLVGVSSATALARAPLGTVRADPDLRWLLESALRETWAVAVKRGIALPEDFVAKLLSQIDKLPADMKASLAADLESGGRLEAPWLCGAVARMSREAGLEAPVNRAVYAALKPYVGGSQVKAR